MITPRQIRAARALVLWGQQDLAEHAGIGVATVRRIEAAHDQITGNAQSFERIQNALELAGIIFIEQDNLVGPGVRLRRPLPTSLNL